MRVRRGPSLRNQCRTAEIYDPGSTFKIVTAAAAIEEKHHLSIEDLIDTAIPATSRFPAANRLTTNITTACCRLTDVIIKSSNVGAIKAGWQIGAERLSRLHVRRFGFGEIHAPDFRGVSGGIVWRPEDLECLRAGIGVDGLSGLR